MNKSAVRTGFCNIWFVLGLAVFLRTSLPIIGYWYTHDRTIFYTPDTLSYVVPAQELVAFHRFFSDGSPEAAVWNTPVTSAPDTVRTPGYPLLLTVGLLLGRLEFVTVALQVLLSCFTVYLVYKTAYLLFESERIALTAATLYAIEPLSILFSSQLAPEAMFTAILMVGVYYLVKYLRRQLPTDLLVSGSALAAAVYVRPAGYFLPLIVTCGLAAWMLGRAQHNKPGLIASLGIFVIVSGGPIGLWQLRNKVTTGYSGFSSVFTEDLYCCSAASVLASQQDLSYTDMQDRLGCYNLDVYFQDHPEQKTWPVARRFNYMNHAAERILLGSPLTYARIYFEGVLRSTFDPGSTEYVRFFDLYPKEGGLIDVAVNKGIVQTVEALFRNPILAWSTVLMLAVQFMYISAACMSVSRRSILDPAILAVLVIMVYYLAIPGGPAVWGRFRHPAMPLMSVFAAYGLISLFWRSPETHSNSRKGRPPRIRLNGCASQTLRHGPAPVAEKRAPTTGMSGL